MTEDKFFHGVTAAANPEGKICPDPGEITIAPNAPIVEDVARKKREVEILGLLYESKRRLDELHDKIDAVLNNN
tara:strand:+ start:726 stop:947 length:222 start_codon:yes stop_codon:yes gene_type:complete